MGRRVKSLLLGGFFNWWWFGGKKGNQGGQKRLPKLHRGDIWGTINSFQKFLGGPKGGGGFFPQKGGGKIKGRSEKRGFKKRPNMGGKKGFPYPTGE